VQIHLAAAPGGGLLVENVGACALKHNGREVVRADVAPGDTLELSKELLFLCVRREARTSAPGGALAVPHHPFGEADAFGIVGESPLVWALRHRIVAVARQRAHVFIRGESGSGKELVARALHARSPRSGRPMVSRNAATIPEGLADAELFGNVRGYPNPGMPERPGLLGEAHESTLFLDEFADLPKSLQAHLLRVMDDGEYQRLGDAKARRSDARILAATNRPERDIKHDVLARFKIHFDVPDLDARREDIPLLVAHLLRQHAAADPLIAARLFPDGDPSAAPRISPIAVLALVQHRYTTHVRELDKLVFDAALRGRNRYLELTTEVSRSIDAVFAAPTDGLEALTAEERTRLGLLRQHGFRPSDCGRDPAYPGNRQTADLHLRQLLCRALPIADWDLARAATLLAGEKDGATHDKVSARLGSLIASLRGRIADEPDEARLRELLTEEWKGAADAVLEVVAALRARQIVGQV
jgi:two-component system nitrogen regulation response regulator GlnG/two-component system response regulator HydG